MLLAPDFLPVRRHVATLTLAAECAVMNVILHMAGNARPARLARP